jgi:hypothetical protein
MGEDVRMPRGMKAELKGLSAQMAEIVGAHLMAAIELIDEDPELAYRHAEAARRRAARLPITREAVAETAYAAGLYEEALAQYRVLRRLTGSPDVIPVMVNCLRALSKHREALELIEEGNQQITDPAMAIELMIESAGVRIDMGQREEGQRILRSELERPTLRHPRLAHARLLCAYAELLLEDGEKEAAYHAFAAAVRIDPEGVTPALDRLDELDGVILDLDATDLGGEDDEDPNEDDGDADEDDADEDSDEDDDEDDEDADEDDAEDDEDADEDAEDDDDADEDDEDADDDEDDEDEDIEPKAGDAAQTDPDDLVADAPASDEPVTKGEAEEVSV